MRVLFIVNSPAAKFPVDVAQRLADEGEIEIKVFPLLTKTRRSTWWYKILFCLRLPFLIKTIRIAIRTYQPDIIHTHFWLSDLIGEFAARPFPHIKLVSTQHDEVRLTSFVAIFKRRALRRFHKVIGISKSVGRFMQEYFTIANDKISVLYDGIDINHFTKGIKSDAAWRPVIGLIARLEPIKGGDIFIEALRRLAVRDQTMQAVVIGDGSQRPKLEKRCRTNGIVNRVRFIGTQNDLISILKELDIVVVPSRSEGLSVTILESLAAKKLVIASEVGGIPELITHRQTGLLVPAENPQALADAMQWAIQHHAEALTIRKRGHDWLLAHKTNFDLSHMIKKYYALYADLAL